MVHLENGLFYYEHAQTSGTVSFVTLRTGRGSDEVSSTEAFSKDRLSSLSLSKTGSANKAITADAAVLSGVFQLPLDDHDPSESETEPAAAVVLDDSPAQVQEDTVEPA